MTVTTTGGNEEQAFSGIRVLDATQGVAGPHSTMLLALHGADVVKLEPPEGDWGRVLGKTVGQHCVHSLAFNRGKRSLCLDAKSVAGRRITRELVASCDVFVESFRPGAIANIGLSWEEVSAINPKIVYASVSGFGQTGPNTKRPTVDLLIQAYSGMMVMNRTTEGVPHRQGMITVDVLTGLYAFQALSTAIIRQIRFGRGCRLDISLMQAAAAFQAAKIMEFHEADGKPLPLYMPSGMMETADGLMVISGMRSAHFKALCEEIGRPDMADDPRYETQELRLKNSPQMMADLRKEFVHRTTGEWLSRLLARGVMAERVRDYGEWLREPHVQATGAVDWAAFEGFGTLPVANIPGVTPIRENPASARVPLIGEDSRTILAEIGYASADIDAMVASGAVRHTAPATGAPAPA